MLSAAGSFVRRHAGKPVVVLFFLVIALVSELSVHVMLRPVGLDAVWVLQTTLSMDVFQAQLADMFTRGVAEQYIAHYYYDFLNPFWYSALLALLLGLAMNLAGVAAARDAWVLLPVAAGLLDEVQNLLHLYMIVDTANVTAPLLLLANGAGLLKLAVLALSLLATAGLFARAAVRRS